MNFIVRTLGQWLARIVSSSMKDILRMPRPRHAVRDSMPLTHQDSEIQAEASRNAGHEVSSPRAVTRRYTIIPPRK